MTGSAGQAFPGRLRSPMLTRPPESDREKNLSTQQAGAQAPPRLPRPHGDQGWPQGHRRPPGAWSQAPVGLSRRRVRTTRRFDEDWHSAMRPDRPIRLSRLKQRKEFLAAAAHGRRFRSSAFSVQVRDAAPEEGQDGLRLGLTASRKVGNSVKRNRIRRRLRAAAAIALGPQAGARLRHRRRRPAGDPDRAASSMLVADLSVALDRARPAKPGPSSRDRRRTPAARRAPVQTLSPEPGLSETDFRS